MLEPLANLPANVIGFEAIGEVEASDYRDVLVPAIDRAAADGRGAPRLRARRPLHELLDGGGVDGRQARLRHLGAWKRVALVSDHDWAQHVVTMFGWMVPGEVKRFAVADQEDAVAWAADQS